MRLLAMVVGGFFLLGCAEEKQLDLNLEFDPPVLAKSVVRIELAVVRSCDGITLGSAVGDDALAVWNLHRGDAWPDTSDEDVSGRSLYALGYDAQCRAVVSGCEAVGKSGDRGKKSLRLTPVKAAVATCSGGEMCTDGACVPRMVDDGGIDAFVPDMDSGMPDMDAGPMDTTAPTVVGYTPADGADGLLTDTKPTVKFSEDVMPGTILVTVTGGSGPVSGSVAYNGSTHEAVFTPTAPLAAATTYTVSVSGAADPAGNAMSGEVSWMFTTRRACPCSIWEGGKGNMSTSNDMMPVEVGFRFRVDRTGYISAIRFHKPGGATGSHTVNLWSQSDGQNLATATQQDPSPSGWQEIAFPFPVKVSSGNEYVASYFASDGIYSYAGNYFLAEGVRNEPLQALGTFNGVFRNGAGFPDMTYGRNNYWVDVVFVDKP